jgi:membrane protein DedA with SNARE-associated domain
MNFLIFETIGAKSLGLLEGWDYGGAFVMSALDRITISLIPTEVLLPLYGFLVGQGVFSFWPVFVIISFGALVGEVILYWIFAKGGRPFVEKYGKYFLVYKHDLDHLDQLFVKHGQKLVFWGRFLPVARAIVAIPAGISRLDIKKFAIFSFFGMLPYNFALIFLGDKMGENFERFRPYLNAAEKTALIILVAFVIWYVVRHLKRRHATH